MVKRYEHIDFTPPKAVQRAAKKGLELRKKFKRGGLSTRKSGKLGIGSGIARAVTLSRGLKPSPDTIRRMHNYFSRHQKDKRPDWDNPKNPSNGYIAWLLWGGDSGKKWADRIFKRMKEADRKHG